MAQEPLILQRALQTKMSESNYTENFDLYSKLITFTELNDVVDGQFLMDLYEIVDANNKANNNISVLNNIILCTIIAYYYDEIQNPEIIIKFINRILPFDEITDEEEKIVGKEIWIMLLKLVTKGLIKEACLVLTRYVKENSKDENIGDYRILLDILINYPLADLQDLKVYKNWKNLTSEYYTYISNKSDAFDSDYIVLVGVLNGNEKDIGRINQVLNLNSANWGRQFLCFFLFYIPTMQLFDEYLVKSLNFNNGENEKSSIYQDFLIKDTSRIISYVPILIDLDDTLGLTFIETLNKLNILNLDVEFIDLIYGSWIKKITDSSGKGQLYFSVNQISILFKLIIQSSLFLSKKRKFVNKLIDSLILGNTSLLSSLNNNDIEYLISILSSLRMPQTCKTLYKELGLFLLDKASLDKNKDGLVDASSLINGLSILTNGLEYHVSSENNENEILAIIVEKSDIVLESNFKQFISTTNKKTVDPFSKFLEDYENFNPILKQAFVSLKVIKELEKIYITTDKDYNKYLTYASHLLKFEPLKDKFKMILLVYYLNPVLNEIKNLSKPNNVTNPAIIIDTMKESNAIFARYEADEVLKRFIQDLLIQYPSQPSPSIQQSLAVLIELFAIS